MLGQLAPAEQLKLPGTIVVPSGISISMESDPLVSVDDWPSPGAPSKKVKSKATVWGEQAKMLSAPILSLTSAV